MWLVLAVLCFCWLLGASEVVLMLKCICVPLGKRVCDCIAWWFFTLTRGLLGHQSS